MEQEVSIGKFKIKFDSRSANIVNNKDLSKIIFLDHHYADVILKVELVNEQLAFSIPTESAVDAEVQIIGMNTLQYQIILK